MRLRIHYMDGEHRDIGFGPHPGAYSWKPCSEGLVVWGHDRDRAHYPWSSIRFYEVLIEDEGTDFTPRPQGPPSSARESGRVEFASADQFIKEFDLGDPS